MINKEKQNAVLSYLYHLYLTYDNFYTIEISISFKLINFRPCYPKTLFLTE